MNSHVPIADLPRPEPNTSLGRVLTFSGEVLIYECCGPDWPDDDMYAVVSLRGCQTHRLGGPNDEARPASSAGIGCYEVVGSAWVIENTQACFAKRGSEVVRQRLLAKRHMRFIFKENEFDCLADGYKLLTCCRTPQEALRAAVHAVGLQE